VPGLEIEVVFEAAGEGIEIGGDLYDVLPTADGREQETTTKNEIRESSEQQL